MDHTEPARHVRAISRHAGTVAAFLVALLWMLVPALGMFIDHDEGFYAVAGRLVCEGQVPYRDFFYPQAPGTPLLFGGFHCIGRVFGIEGLVLLRVCSAAIAAAALGGCYLVLRRRLDAWGAAAICVLVASNPLFVEWAATAKTHGPTMLALVCCAGAVLQVRDAAHPRRWCVVAGVAAGAAISLRTMTAPTVLLLVTAGVFFSGGTLRTRVQRLGVAAGATAVSLLPFAALWVASPEGARFGNLGYHALRTGDASRGLVGDPEQKLSILKQLVGLSHPIDEHAVGIGIAFLVCLAAVGVVSQVRQRPEYGVLGLATACLLTVSLLPTPTFLQYFVLVLPLLALCAAGLPIAGTARSLLLAAAAWTFLVSLPGWKERAVDGVRGPWDESRYRPAAVDAVSRKLCEHTPEGMAIGSHWPSYLVACDRPVHPTTVNQFAFDVAHLLEDDQRQRLHVYGVPDVSNALRSGEIGGFVFGRFSFGVRTDVIPSLVEQGWERVHRVPAGDVWIAPRSP